MLPAKLENDRRRAGWSVGQVVWRLGSKDELGPQGGEDHERTSKGGPRESSDAGGMDSLGATPARGRPRGKFVQSSSPQAGPIAPRLPSECCP
jgi:hypothetical protein